MKLAEDNGVRIIGCLQSLELNGMTTGDLAKDLPLLTPVIGKIVSALPLANNSVAGPVKYMITSCSDAAVRKHAVINQYCHASSL